MASIGKGDLIVVSGWGYLHHKTPNGVHIETFVLDDFSQPWGVKFGPGGKVYVAMDEIWLALYPGETFGSGYPGILVFESNLAGMLIRTEYEGDPNTGGGTIFNAFGEWGFFDSDEDIPRDICFANGKMYVLGYAFRHLNPTSPVYKRDTLAITEYDMSGTLLNRWEPDVDYDGWNGVFRGRIAADCDGILYYTHYSQSIFRFDPVTGLNLTPLAVIDRRLPFQFGSMRLIKNAEGGTEMIVALSEWFTSFFQGPFATGSPTYSPGGPRQGIALHSDKTTFWADDNDRRRPDSPPTAQRYRLFRFGLAAGADVASTTVGDGTSSMDTTFAAMDSKFDPCVADVTRRNWISTLN